MIKRNKGIKIGLNYDTDKNIRNLQADFMALLLDHNGKLISHLHFIFYNNLKSPDGSVEHLGNIMIGSNDAAQIIADTAKADALVKHILFFVTIHQASLKKQSFSMINNLRLNFTSLESGADIAEFVPEKDNYYNSSSLIALAELVKSESDWQLSALGDCYRISPDEFTDLLLTDYSYQQFKEVYYRNYKHFGGDTASVRAVIEREREEEYYRLLECTYSSTNNEIKKKYKELAKSFHPDIIQSKGLHKDIIDFAAKRFKDIKEAYEYLKNKRKL